MRYFNSFYVTLLVVGEGTNEDAGSICEKSGNYSKESRFALLSCFFMETCAGDWN
jgi:hypothetical protein